MAKRPRKGSDPERRMSLAEHLIELRKRLTISAVAILLVGIAGGIWLAPIAWDALRAPILEIATTHKASINYTSITEAFDLRVQLALTIGVVGASPVWLYQVFAFFVPGLTKRERKYTLGFFLSAIPLFFAGAVVGWLIFPHMAALLLGFAPSEDATFLTARYFLDFVTKLVLAVGIAFVLPVFLVLLNFVGILSAAAIIKGWRVAILVITLFCATATPAADIISMFLLAIPMVLLYFIAAGVAWWHDRGVARREAVLEGDLTAAEPA